MKGWRDGDRTGGRVERLSNTYTAVKRYLLRILHGAVKFISRDDLIFCRVACRTVYTQADEYRFRPPLSCHFIGFSDEALGWKSIIDNEPCRTETHYHWLISSVLLVGEMATAVDSKTGKVILETVYGVQDYFTRSGDLKYYLTRSFRKIEKTLDYAIVLNNCLARNYYHWSLEILPLLNCYDAVCKLLGGKVTVIVPNKLPRFAREQLMLLGIEQSDILEWDFKKVKVRNLVVPQYYRSNDSTLPIFSQTPFNFLKRLGDQAANDMQMGRKDGPTPPCNRIYVSRRDQESRGLVNLADLLQIATQHGCIEVDIEELNFKQQVNLFANAEFVMTVTGAALMNLIYCKKACTVIELCPRWWGTGAFYQIAARVDLDYHLLCLDPVDDKHNSLVNSEHLQYISNIFRKINDGSRYEREGGPPT